MDWPPSVNGSGFKYIKKQSLYTNAKKIILGDHIVLEGESHEGKKTRENLG